jgi:hypothetical protein
VGVKRPGREVDHSPPLSAGVKECVELYLYSPTSSRRGAWLSTGTTLPLPFIHLVHRTCVRTYIHTYMNTRERELQMVQLCH